ncbi:UDP-glucuronosyl/UDP-glucosyltransferase [Cinara cedri]|uniref:UDP-glucuronosyl/UDP-glucosyltransferase n=1 Tax=Cinara cedri TaxID=506608 RepID=A0A5E4MMN6_9HEMI|nr:UDP-glucuronosyl/UDP-glucosyltransferase [Cinara cedri]
MSRFKARERLLAIVILVLTLQPSWSPVGAANILAVQTVPGLSHWNVMRSVLRPLIEHGHNVTAFTPFVDGDRDNYVEVDMSDVMRVHINENVTYVRGKVSTTATFMAILINITRSYCDVIHEHPRMTEILTAALPSEFDLLITQPVASKCVAYVATVLRIPLVYVVVPAVFTDLERSISGQFPNPATFGHTLFPRAIPKTFLDRLSNTVLTVYCSFLLRYNEWWQKVSDPRPYDDVDLIKPSITFTNAHYITDFSRPLTPDVISIGGIHLTPPKELPKDILEFIEDSPHGVIYFTFGSIMMISSLPVNVQKAFMDVFRKIPQRVLWKSNKEIEDLPPNVMVNKSFPQRDILLHPNVKLFICHGSISGVYEAVDAGVPVLGFPIVYDQPINMKNLVDAGMAISVNMFSITNDTLLTAITELVNNESYRNNAKVASKRFKDRPVSPAESVVYWTEYVLRHNGAPHLKSPAINLIWYQYFLLDVIGTLLVVAFVVWITIQYICQLIFLSFCRGKEKRE